MEIEEPAAQGEPALPGWTRPAGVAIGIGGAAAVLLLAPADLPPQARSAAAVTALVASFWLFEVLPLAVTSLLPIALLPLSGALDTKSACRAYGDPLVFLMLVLPIAFIVDAGFSEPVRAAGIERRHLYQVFPLMILGSLLALSTLLRLFPASACHRVAVTSPGGTRP